jgi:hypothetical protein
MENEFDLSYFHELKSEVREGITEEIFKGLCALYISLTANFVYDLKQDPDINPCLLIQDIADMLMNDTNNQYLNFYFKSLELNSPESHDYYKQLIDDMLSLNYEPPKIGHKLYDYLVALLFYYGGIYHLDTLCNQQLYIALIRTLTTSYIGTSMAFRKLVRDSSRINKSKETKKKKKSLNKDIVIEIFYKLKIENMKMNKVTKIIVEQLRKKNIFISSKTVGRYLQEDDKVMSDLKSLGVIK